MSHWNGNTMIVTLHQHNMTLTPTRWHYDITPTQLNIVITLKQQHWHHTETTTMTSHWNNNNDITLKQQRNTNTMKQWHYTGITTDTTTWHWHNDSDTTLTQLYIDTKTQIHLINTKTSITNVSKCCIKMTQWQHHSSWWSLLYHPHANKACLKWPSACTRVV